MKKLISVIFILFSFVYANNCEGKLFSYSNSFNVANRVSIKSFLDSLVTQRCNVNIVIEDEKAKTILNEKMPFVRIKDYTLREILDLLLTKRNLFYRLDNDVLEISYYKTKNYKIDFISSTRKGISSLGNDTNKISNDYQFDFWEKLQNQLKILLENTKQDKNDKVFEPIVNKDTGVVVVTGDMQQIKAVDNFMEKLMSSLTKEVLIDVKIYSVELSKSHKTGIDWSKLSISLPNSSVPLRAKYIAGSASIFNSATFNTAAFLNFLAQNGNVNSISNPKIMTLNNQKAIISVGDTIYYKYASKVVSDQNGNPQTQYNIESKFVGVILDITPQISDNGTIILSIAPRISAFRDLSQISTQTIRTLPPDTKDNTMLSVVKVKDNDTIVLGGLISDDRSLKVNGVPILKEIPLVKYLFSSRENITNKKELVFVITPHIINFKKKKTLRDLGFDKIR